jgi:hypothetical protein
MVEAAIPYIDLRTFDWSAANIAERKRAKSARESFVVYFQAVGRTEAGEPLKLDPEILKSAEAMEQGFFAGLDAVFEQGRGTLKSTLGVYFHAWMFGNYPWMTVGHFSCSEDKAKRRNKWLQKALGQDEHTQIFGKDGSFDRKRSNQKQTTVRGNKGAVPNVIVSGIEAARAGPHFHRLWFDDVVDENTSLVQPAKLEVIKSKFFTTIKPMLYDAETLGHGVGKTGVGRYVYFGTPYAEDDLHDHICKTAREQLPVVDANRFSQVNIGVRAMYRRLAFGGPDDGFFNPVPSCFSTTELRAEWQANERAYKLSRMLIAIGIGEKPFSTPRPANYWLPERWTMRPDCLEQLGEAPHVLPSLELESDTHKWPRLCVVDPAFKEKTTSCYTGMTIATLGPDGTIYVLFTKQFKLLWDKAREEIAMRFRQYKCDRLLIEDVAQQSACLSWFREQKDGSGRNIICESIVPAGASKLARARDVSGDWNQGRVCIPGRINYAERLGKMIFDIGPVTDRGGATSKSYGHIGELLAQMASFPARGFCDLLDSFVYAIQEFRRGLPPVEPAPAPVDLTDTQRSFNAASRAMFGPEPKEEKEPEWACFVEPSVDMAELLN